MAKAAFLGLAMLCLSMLHVPQHNAFVLGLPKRWFRLSSSSSRPWTRHIASSTSVTTATTRLFAEQQQQHSHRQQDNDHHPQEQNNNNNNNMNTKKKKGYQFGDISRFLAKTAAAQITQLTGKDRYEFGDLTRWMDQQAKTKVANLTQNKNEEYQVGHLTKWVLANVAQQQTRGVVVVSNNNSTQTSAEKGAKEQPPTTYQFGDITREILRRIQTGEYELQDVWLALRILLSAGATLTPIASSLPLNWLLGMINLGLAQDVGGRLLQVLASSLDERIKEAVTGDSQYRLGDLTKKKLLQAVADFTGNESGTYQFGDISRKLLSLSQDEQSNNSKRESTAQEAQTQLVVSKDIVSDLEDWDRRFQSRRQKQQP